MSLTRLLFSFEGRTRRLHYWLFSLALFAISIAATALVAPTYFSATPPASPSLGLTLISLLLMYPALAVTLKRTNDINWSPLWANGLTACSVALLIGEALVPDEGPLGYAVGAGFLISLILAIVIGCIRSADAENAHGPNPLAVTA
jgi:uncharacterized membrane protein YhaH (DUF805 family)